MYKCVHCGFCLNACPTYLETGLEAESPRGRIALMKGVNEGRLDIGLQVISHWELCVQCRACEVACPSNVPFGRMMEGARVELNLTVKRLMTNPAFDLVIPDGSLTLGEGTWNGQAKLSYANARVQGSGSGKIGGVDINEMMSALTSASDKVSGTVAVPQYSVRFAGAGADQIRDSLAGSGNLTLEEGEISAFNLLGTIQKHADKLLGGNSSEPGETEFTTLSSDFEIRNQQVHLMNILLDSPASDVTGQGYLTFEKELHFDLETTIQGALAATLGGKPNSEGTIVASVPVKIRGTMDSPRVSPDIGRIVGDKVKGVLDSLFKKRQPPSEEAPGP